MKERPILFNGEMVNAVLEDRKTHTRRIIKDVPMDIIHIDRSIMDWPLSGVWKDEEKKKFFLDIQTDVDDYSTEELKPRLGKAGDQLWVRENFNIYYHSTGDLLPRGKGIPKTQPPESHVVYAADWDDPEPNPWPMYPSIHMPRWASRIDLLIKNVRVERIQSISEKDAKSEGISSVNFYPDEGFPLCTGYMVGSDDGKTVLRTTAKEAFRSLWISINGQESWNANPWVWAYEFDRIKP